VRQNDPASGIGNIGDTLGHPHMHRSSFGKKGKTMRWTLRDIRGFWAMLLGPACKAHRLGFIAALIVCSCTFFDEACTCDQEIRMNVCVSGTYAGQDSVLYSREILGVGFLDGDTPISGCFSERGEKQRILVLKGGVKVDSSDWFKQEEVECCHFEPVNVEF
jgi:hypothetical protein